MLNSEIGMSKLSNKYSPNTLVTGQAQKSNNEIMQLTFGEYAEVHTANQTTNNNEERTISAIALYPSGNQQ